jgi:[ribosomal protein S5]-alanine N-acetyltransferase
MKLPPFKIFPKIAGDKISLRQIHHDDIKDIVEISYYDSIQASSLKQAIEMQAKINNDYMEGNSIHWGISENSTNKIIGTCGYYRGLDKGAGELGCILLPQYRGQGLMTASMRLAIDFGINTIGLKRIRAITSRQNGKAIKLLGRLHFEKVADLEGDEIEFELMSKK